MDSHKDVHISGIWDKSVRENKYIMHLREHQMKYDYIISDDKDLNVEVKEYSWSVTFCSITQP